jgi:hypothetical protein
MVLLSKARRDGEAWWVDWWIRSGVLLEILRSIADCSGKSLPSRGISNHTASTSNLSISGSPLAENNTAWAKEELNRLNGHMKYSV